MALTREKKSQILKDTQDRLDKASVVVFTNFHGLDMPGVTSLRKGMRAEGADYVVIKKRILDRALKAAGFDETPVLGGEVGVAFGYDDPTAAARNAYEFAKSHSEQFQLLGGIFEKRIVTAAEVRTLATIPPREVLLAQLANVIASPLTNLVRTLNGVNRQFVFVLGRIADQKT